MKLTFVQVKMKVFNKLVLSNLMGAAKHVQSTQNNKYAISLQYLKKGVSNEVDFLHSNKHQKFLHPDKHHNFLQFDGTFCMGLARHT